MPGRVQDKVAIVTGGGTGIGQGIATLLAREGARVIVAGRTPESGEETVAQIRVGGGNLFAYSVSKGALLTLTRNLARAHAREKIRVNFVNPGWVITPGEIRI